MSDVVFLALRYLRHYRGQTLLLIGSISLILFIPSALQVVALQAADILTSRADTTPLLIGARGSSVDLALSALYFQEPSLESIPFTEVEQVRDSGLALAIPLHLRYRAGGHPVVGTTLEYLDFRSLRMAAGRRFAILGECVLGATAARGLGMGPGDELLSSPAGAFDVGGTFPLKMKVVGVLGPAGTPDDDAVFVDVKTAWIISGLAHGHDDVAAPGAEAGIASRDDELIVANPSVLSYTEITADNIDSFHFHGDPAQFPVDAVIAVPNDRRQGIVLRGRYVAGEGPAQMLVPRDVVDELVETMFSVRDAIAVVAAGVGLGTVAVVVLVFVLSIRLRRREIATIRKIGGSRRRLLAILGTEIVVVVLAALLLAGTATLAVSSFGDAAIRWLGS